MIVLFWRCILLGSCSRIFLDYIIFLFFLLVFIAEVSSNFFLGRIPLGSER